MSLRPDGRGTRSRSKSPGRERERSRSRSNVRAPEAPRAPSPPSAAPYGYPEPPAYGNGVTSPMYEVRSPGTAGAERSNRLGKAGAAPIPYPSESSIPYPRDYGGYFPEEPEWDNDLAYGDVKPPGGSRQASYSDPYPPQSSQVPYAPRQPESPYAPQPPGAPGYRYNAEPVTSGTKSSSYSYQYFQQPEKVNYASKPQIGGKSVNYTQTPQGQSYQDLPRNYASNTYDRDAQVVERTPGKDKREGKSSTTKSARLSLDTRGAGGGLQAPRSPGLGPRMDRLSVSGDRPDLGGSGGLPPPSPMLEAYHGTYQQLSPMPLALRPDDDDELSEIEPLSPAMIRPGGKSNDKLAQEATRNKEKKRVQLYDPEEDAKTISQALGRSTPKADAICDVLPGLVHDRIMELRKEYKKQVKIQGKGVNLPKHLKTKLTGNFGKAAYVTALGKWESEGYWANFWYQSHTSRRELLIESLMGRTNNDIWQIKDEFKDKRYSDDLVKCMEKELKMDKFRTAVLMVLEERRQEEQDVYPVEYRNRDVDSLHKAITAKQGGESTMLEIIVRRSDAHLREVLKMYERLYQENLARAALRKSSNLVGEVIAHVLNGVINKPGRDAMLLQHAINDIAEKNKEDELRYELLISRLVRLHWDKPHLMRVKKEYRTKYKRHLEEDIQNSSSGDFADFMYELCQTK